MDIRKKKEEIEYNGYRYKTQKYNSEETKEFFDPELVEELLKSSNGNIQKELLSFFDFSDIFKDNEYGPLQHNLLMYMIRKSTIGIDTLIEKWPSDMKIRILCQIYMEINDERFFSNCLNALKDDEEKYQFFILMNNQISDYKLTYTIGNLYEKKEFGLLSLMFKNERVVKIAINNIRAPFLYEMVETTNLPNSFIEERKKNLREIILDYNEYEPKDVKNAYIELYLQDILSNVFLDIKSIYVFANTDMEVKQLLGNMYDEFDSLMAFMEKPKELSQEDINRLNKPIEFNQEYLQRMYEFCQARFKTVIQTEVTKDVYEGIHPKVVKSSLGKEVLVYEMENQSAAQSYLPMLVSSVPVYSERADEFKKAYYSEKNGELIYKRRCFSIIDETRLNCIYGKNSSITFGYEDLSGRRLTVANLSDGGTDGNDIRYGKKRKIRESSFLPLKEFVSKILSHSEILLEMDEAKDASIPSYILVSGREPTQLEIDIAGEFGIPIRLVDEKKYEQAPYLGTIPYKEYEYMDFYKPPVIKKREKEVTIK